ncbi:unnamed protein product (macronuclear) [Paramecium tetraurelia]|uniref:Oxysterol-binding protein n=1 Tax=Paramecium tetraurelia TaxID=5888 RepID=A0CI33_PARTE|nr:uncharacterized protein GSPATT00038554001 [Paramecium tetraurelia]CAK70450.1 unnamed protein product [Paramecium tetraurelia]|eukprot:XP_001437847.1 hypothetical protein (macronuclear) [Paramecium tetraurelia strain d4-2]
MQQNNRVIYELEDDEDIKQAPFPKSQAIKIDRKLGAVSYIKWGTLYNYFFSFDLRKGRLLCYKTQQSSSYNNYYSLNKGDFVRDEAEIQKCEQSLRKKKNYQQANDQKSVIYVRTAKGRVFKLMIDENENYDKILGYLQICFSSKMQNVKAFYALLGIGLVKIDGNEFKLTTGVVVSLNDWSINNNNNYLLKNDSAISNYWEASSDPSINNMRSWESYSTHRHKPSTSSYSIIFSKLSHNINRNPKVLHQAIFKLVKFSKKRVIPSGKGQLLKLKTDIAEFNQTEYIEIAKNDNVKIYIHNSKLNVADYALIQGSMFSAQYVDDQNDLDGDKLLSNNALEFYKKNFKNMNNQDDETKEFIVVSKQQTQVFVMNNQSSPNKGSAQKKSSFKFDDISDESGGVGSGVQVAKSIKVHMRRQVNGVADMSPKMKFISDFQGNEFESAVNYANEINEQKQADDDKNENQDVNENGNGTNNKQEASDNQQGNNYSKMQCEEQQQVVVKNEQQLLQHQPSKTEQNQEEDSDEIDLVKVSIVFDEGEHCNHRDFNTIMNYALNFKKVDYKDEYRVPQAHKKGGTACQDEKIIDLARSVGKNMIKQVGQKLLSGNFNLTTVSFPIKAMIPKSALEKTFMQTILFPLYMNKAASLQKPLERMKLSIVALISNYIQANSFLKPLNPILGETFEGGYEDGTQLYCEQISHHPPLSYFLVYGPKKSYKFFGYSLYEAKAGLNSLTILNHGKRTIQFPDQKIVCTFSSEHYSGTFFGTMKNESQGALSFVDEVNNLNCIVQLGKVKNKPTDYFEGEIKQGKTVLSKLFGSYMGFADFDGIRYWDARVIKPFAMQILKSNLDSDHTKRTDRICMIAGDMNKAQVEKERLEQSQRNDAALRKEFLKQKKKKDQK